MKYHARLRIEISLNASKLNYKVKLDYLKDYLTFSPKHFVSGK